MAIKEIKVNEFPESIDPKNWVVVADENGVSYKISKENLKAYLGTVQQIAPEPAPSFNLGAPGVDKVYYGGAGTYILNGVSVSFPQNINIFFWDKADWRILEVPIDVNDIQGQVIVTRGVGEASLSGNPDLVLEGGKEIGEKGFVFVNVYNDGDVILVQGGGNVGIGVVDALARLHIKGGHALLEENGPSFFEFNNKAALTGVKVNVGMLGSPEANLSFNMDYKTAVHKYYDPNYNAMWLALGSDMFALQYAPKGSIAEDIWTGTGSRYLFWGDKDGRFTINTADGENMGDAQLYVKTREGKATFAGDDETVIEGNKTSGVRGNVYLNKYNDGDINLCEGGGKVRVKSGNFALGNSDHPISEYLDNADAISKGCVIGDIYRTGDLLKIVH